MRTTALAVLVLFAVGCGPVDPGSEEEVGDITEALGSWVKVGTLPSGYATADQSGMTYAHGKLWIATVEGLMEGRPGSPWTWRQVLTANNRFAGIGSSSTSVLASTAYGIDPAIRRAPTTGNGWLTVGSNLDAVVYDFVRSPSGAVYADLGSHIAVSNDAGATWQVAMDQPYDDLYGREGCLIEVVSAANRLYQSCLGFWSNWVVSYDLSGGAATLAAGPTFGVDSNLIPFRNFPSAIASAPSSDRAYVGLNGGLVWVRGEEWDFVWDGDEQQEVTAIWVDPANANHLLFGGYHSGLNKIVLMETFNGGLTVSQKIAPSTLGLVDPVLNGFAPAGYNNDRLALVVETGDWYSPRKTVVILVTP